MTLPGNSPANSLNEETRLARALLALLQTEQEQLIAADIEKLTALTEEKGVIVAQLSALAANRHQALAAAGFANQDAGMQAWLEKSASPSATQSWNQLMSLAQAAKEINRINGMLITKHLARNQSALNIVKGGPQGQTFYGPNGQSSVKTTVRGLVIG